MASSMVHGGGKRRAVIYFENEPGRRAAAKLLTNEEARRIALNIANYFVFISRTRVGVSGAGEMFLALRG